MVKRYDLYFGGFDVGYIVDEADDGGYVAYDDYAALQAENERLKAERVDMEQFRRFIHACGYGAGASPERTAEADRLLALIDGHAKRSHALDAWTDEQCAEFLSVAMRHVQIKGVLTMNEIRQGQMRANAMQPTKGEGE